TASDNQEGIYIYYSNSSTLTDITASGNQEQGIYITNSYNNTLTDVNASYNSNTGIYIITSNSSTISNSTASSNTGMGVYIIYSFNSTLTNITANNNQYGIWFGNTVNNTLTNSTVSNNSEFGVYISGTGNSTLSNVTITTTGNQGGLYAPGSSTNRNNIPNSVTVDAKPVQYFDGFYKPCPNNDILNYNDTYSQVTFISCDNVTLENTTVTDSIYLSGTDNSTFTNIVTSNATYGIRFGNSANNTLTNITASGNSDTGIFITASINNTLTNITISQDSGRGIYLLSSDSNTITNAILSASATGTGVYIFESEYNNLINITVSNFTSGIHLYADSKFNNMTEITASSNTYGIWLQHNVDNNMVNDSRMEGNSIAGIWLDDGGGLEPEDNLIYNNYLNNTQNMLIESGIGSPNYFNTTLNCSSGPNIIGSLCIGGNYWTDPDGSNFSDECADADSNGICDSGYEISTDYSWAWDFSPLTYTPVRVYLESPSNNTENTTDRTPDFIFNATDQVSPTLSCELFLNQTDTGSGTPTGYDINTSTQNDTSTTLTANTSLSNGYYDWWISCTNTYGKSNTSEVRNISIQLPLQTYTCSSCSECDNYVQNEMFSGDTLQLTSNISDTDTCISFGGADNLTLDCMGYTISGDGGGGSEYGIWLNDTGGGSNNNTIRNCANISYFNHGIYILTSDFNTLTNITTQNNIQHGIFPSTSDFNTLTNITTQNNIQSGIYFSTSNSNTLTNITIRFNSQYGIRIIADSKNNTINNSRIEGNTLGGILLDEVTSQDPEYNLIYNNYFNNTVNMLIDSGIPSPNYFNTTLDCSSGPNIIGGPCIGGNYWTDPDGNFSDECTDANGNGICDSEYNLTNGTSVAYDYIPLSYTPVLIYLEYPLDNAENTTTDQPDFIFNVTDLYYSSTYSCELFLNQTDSGSGTPQPYGINTSTQNDTTTTLTANASLSNGYYDWWINCTNEYSQTNQSEIRNISIQFTAPAYTCSNCSDCSNYLQNGTMSSGDTLQLTSNISTTGTCISFGGADNLTFDCMGFTISGDGSVFDYGITLPSSDNNTIRNCANISYFNYGIYVTSSKNNTITNSTLQKNSYDLYVNTGSDADCDNTLQNITGSGGRPIGYYNYAVNLSDQTFSQLILCNADDSNITNITIMGSDTIDNNALVLHRTENTNLTGINSSYNAIGVLNDNSTNNTFTDITANSNSFHGILTSSGSEFNTFTDITANSNNNGISIQSASISNTISNITANYNNNGIYISVNSNLNNLTDITASSNNQYGIYIGSNTDNSTINNSRIENNTLAGIYLDVVGGNEPEYNLFYNNYINNTLNLLIETSITEENYFNTTLDCSAGPNIIGGPCIGGNYWTDPDGSNFSDECVDSDGNGICDSEYNLTNQDSVAYDYLPLSYTPVLVYLEYPLDNAENTTIDQPDFIFNTSDVYSSTYSCELFLNQTDTGSGTPQPYGINTSTQNDTTTTLTANASLS
ncbi:MAG: NosD domain-containing protein, partial [Candidatus Thorarchaeota archaeon]